MDDLTLWHLLTQNPPALKSVGGLLDVLAQEPVWGRLPFLGYLGPHLRHKDAKRRCSALAALAGAQGVRAYRHLVDGLDDPETSAAAVEALRVSCDEVNSVRWAHALFHPDPKVRLRAVDPDRPWPRSCPIRYALYLLADPVCRDSVRRLLQYYPLNQAEEEIINELFREGLITESMREECLHPRPLAAVQQRPSFPDPPAKPAETAEDVELEQNVAAILAVTPAPPQVHSTLRKYLDQGTRRPFEQRYRAAHELVSYSGYKHDLFPVLLQNEFRPNAESTNLVSPSLLVGLPKEVIVPIAESVMLADMPNLENEFKLLDLIAQLDPYSEQVQQVLSMILAHGRNPQARKEAQGKLAWSNAQSGRMLRLGRSFAWGVQLGYALTGRRFHIQMLSNEQLGYTRFNEDKLYITPMPILRDEPFGEVIVRGLILHEYGHHLYHKSPEGMEVWEQADRQSLGKLLNLVADEHLERNLRHLEPVYGHFLKRLNSYAFQVRRREIPLETILHTVGVKAFAVLGQVTLGVARDRECVLVRNGRILRAMEAAGMSFARFLRALRMGLGNRYDDPKVEAGLALFKGKFRKLEMPGLYEIAKRLQEIFAEETQMLDWMGQDESLRWPDDYNLPSPDQLKQAMDQGNGGNDGKSGQKLIPAPLGANLDPSVQFQRITKITKLKHDPAAHANYASKIAREAQLLRRCLLDLGLGFVAESLRTQGRRLDRGRMLDLVLQSDPRVLIARRRQRITDLFIGVLIDCSSSMTGEKVEKAKVFGTLVAEAVKNQRGIDLRLFGFNEIEIFDAGNARQCAVHALNAWGGNNDAAALQHASDIAQTSARKAKLLIMISDGLPSNCSVAALQNLVSRLTRKRFCCAQVAVAPLEQFCFPHYILLDDSQLTESVRKFGAVVRRLVQQALGCA